jgi:hypothetical protein
LIIVDYLLAQSKSFLVLRIDHVFFDVVQEPALLGVQNALMKLRGIINALLDGHIAGLVAQEMADEIMEPFSAVQIGAVPLAPAAHANAGQVEEEIEEELEGAISGQAIAHLHGLVTRC